MANEYEEFVRSIPLPGRIGDAFTSLDNRLDFLGPKIVELLDRVKALESAISKISAAEVTMPEIEQIPFAYDVPALGGVTLVETPPFSGYIRYVTIHWPDGCNALVDVRIGHGSRQFCPNDGYLALNDATPTYQFNEYVAQDEEIWVEIRNGDAVNSHAVSVTLTIESS
ncbi:MAG: hypothetical protein ACTSYX_05500 [Candidatus Thorarchaeota archaeon]